jgi:pyruvate dehydrogenase E1 component
MPEGCYEGVIKGMYLLETGTGDRGPGTGKDKSSGKGKDSGKSQAGSKSQSKDKAKSKNKKVPRVQLMGAGGSLRNALEAAELLEKDFGVAADVWSCPSFSELSREGFDCERYNRLHPTAKKPRVPYVTECLSAHEGPVVAATEYVRAVGDQVRAFMPEGRRYTVLGADGYGRSDTREALRDFFEVDQYWIAHAALDALARDGVIEASEVTKAIKKYGLDKDKPNPLAV